MSYLLVLSSIFIGSFITFFGFVLFTYYFQIKEYRFDRFFSALKELGILYFIFPSRLYLPKKSVRNVTIASIVGGTLCVYLIISVLLFKQLILPFLFMPLVMFCTLPVAVTITGRISMKKRNEVIAAATTLRNNSSAEFIGITGSYGKSSTKEFLAQLLSLKYTTGKTIGNYNTPIGVAMSINANLKDDTQYFVTEMGAYKKGEIASIARFVKPTYGVITGLSNQHLSLFGSKQNLIEAKSELFESLPKNSIAFLNADSSDYSVIYNKYKDSLKIFLYSATRTDVDLSLLSFTSHNGTSEAKYKIFGEQIEISSRLKGRHNYINLMPAIGLAIKLGVTKEAIVGEILKMENAFGKLSVHNNTAGVILYDGYSSNFQGFLAALEVLGTFDSPQKLVVTKGIIELGKDKKVSYQEILQKTSTIKARIVTTDKLFKKLDTSNLVTLCKSEKKMVDMLSKDIAEPKTILVEGRFSDKFNAALGISE